MKNLKIYVDLWQAEMSVKFVNKNNSFSSNAQFAVALDRLIQIEHRNCITFTINVNIALQTKLSNARMAKNKK